MKTYHIDNLGQMAAMFRDMANNEVKFTTKGTRLEQQCALARVGCWERAAAILEDTELKPQEVSARAIDLTV